MILGGGQQGEMYAYCTYIGQRRVGETYGRITVSMKTEKMIALNACIPVSRTYIELTESTDEDLKGHASSARRGKRVSLL